ncbi:CTP synthase 2 [Chelonia mydas]|uniref:CTP synthase (glutamine hydrolyzing) n=1 Tax=Chelonia mydas TaxID=8469 RepID=M7BBU1_CHEMY|nr:CTP synthase 2 [Chelonia mydas]
MVIDMPEHNPGDMGGTMRLGKRRTVFKTEDSVLRKLYGDEDFVEERHRHRYEVNPELTGCFEEKGLKFVGRDTEGSRMEIIELERGLTEELIPINRPSPYGWPINQLWLA